MLAIKILLSVCITKSRLVSTIGFYVMFLAFASAGLGEMMPAQLWETTMNPDTRILKQLVVDDAAETNMVFSSLMGARVSQ